MMRKQLVMIGVSVLLICVVFSGCNKEWTPRYGVNYPVKIINVVDGDTFDAVFPNGTIGRIRLLGVDCPETTPEMNKKYEYDNITDLECLASYGLESTCFAEEWLSNKIVYIRFDSSAGFKGCYGRWLAYVFLLNKTDFGEQLIKKGYARVYTEGNCSKENYYVSLQQQAMENKTGLWSCPSEEPRGITIVTVHYNAAGNDWENLNDEYVVIKNYKTMEIEMTGYTLGDEANHVYIFPDEFILNSEAEVTVHTGSGTDTDEDLYWNNDYPIWNNDGDTAYLWDANGSLVDYYSWG